MSLMMIPADEAQGVTWFNYELWPCQCGATHRVAFKEPRGEPVYRFNEGFCRFQAGIVAEQRRILGFD